MDNNDVTLLLERVNQGEARAYDALIGRVYEELRRMAANRMRMEAAGHTLQPTALVNEACLRLIGSGTDWQNRRHFFGAAAEAMRRVLVDHARRRDAAKRGGGLRRVTLTNLDIEGAGTDVDLLALEDALTKLEGESQRLARLVELRFFAGLSIEEAAAALEVSPATVKRDWSFARAWLLERLDQ
ncbi:MAG TPA: sigma-70 family RNA polymerase sigma factor [Gammaproteobacteria bacterium]